MSDKNAFSDREMQIMAMAWQCFTEQPKVNYDKLAKLCNFSNVKSASNAWGAIKKKLAAQGTGGDAADGTTTPKATKVTPKKRGKKAAEEDDEDDDEEATPAKKAKGRKGRATKKAKSEEVDGENGSTVKPEASSDEE